MTPKADHINLLIHYKDNDLNMPINYWQFNLKFNTLLL